MPPARSPASTSGSRGPGGGGRSADANELDDKHDQELIELLNELRVVLPGVQVLFAFLLTVPFTQRFDDVGDAQQTAYMVGLLSTLVGTILLIAPSAYHRLRWRERNKERMLRTSNRLAIAGFAFVALAMTASVYLVSETVIETTAAIVVTAMSALLFLAAWFALPLSRPYDRWDELDDHVIYTAGDDVPRARD